MTKNAMRTLNITGNFKNRYRINDFQHKTQQKPTQILHYQNNPTVMYLQQSRVHDLCAG